MTGLKKIARITLGLFMLHAAVGHFTFMRQEFQAQVPDWLPLSKDLVVLLSGIVELGLGLALFFLPNKRKAGIALAVFFVLIFPGNISQYLTHTDAFQLNTDSARLVRLFFQPVLIFWALWSTNAFRRKRKGIQQVPGNFYDLQATTISGETIQMDVYKGKTILIVNTASKCGLTPQFEGLEALFQKYKSKDFVILGFPCNQFANQEPGTNADVSEFCQINYGVSFPMFAKVDVNGEDAHPIFEFLKEALGGWLTDNIKWNFTKFLIDKKGKPIKRFAPPVVPAKIDDYLSQHLS